MPRSASLLLSILIAFGAIVAGHRLSARKRRAVSSLPGREKAVQAISYGLTTAQSLSEYCRSRGSEPEDYAAFAVDGCPPRAEPELAAAVEAVVGFRNCAGLALVRKSAERTPSEAGPAPVGSAGGLDLVVQLLFDGLPVSDFSRAVPQWSAWLKAGGADVPGLRAFLSRDGWVIRGLSPGRTAVVAVSVDGNEANPERYPGDFEGDITVTVPEPSQPIYLHLARVMRLTRPVDSAGLADDSVPEFSSPVRFSWEEVRPGEEYAWAVFRLPGNIAVLNDRTSESDMDLTLPPSAPGENYVFRLSAQKNGRRIGTLVRHFRNADSSLGVDFEVPFRVAR